MNKSNRDYQRNQTTNSFNQDFIYYKYSKELSNNSKDNLKDIAKYSKDISKSPKFKKQPKNHQESLQTNNHSKIQSMKNTLNTLFDPPVNNISKSFHKSVADYDFKRKTQIPKNSKSVYEQDHSNSNFNNKLQLLTSKLRQIAQKPHFSTNQQSKKFKCKQTVKHHDDTYLANMSLIQKGSQKKNNSKFEQFFLQQNKKIIDNKKPKSKGDHNFSQQLSKGKTPFSHSVFDQDISSLNSQSSSIKREMKGLKNEKSVGMFNYPQQNNLQFQISQRPRGKTATNILQNPMILEDIEQAKIKINSLADNRQASKSFQHNKRIVSQTVKEDQNLLQPHIVKVLKPHRGPITSVIINSDGRRFLSASYDYSVKQSTLDDTFTAIRCHQGRVNVMRMIDDKLYTGGNDCRVKYEKESFLFSSPVLEVYPHEKSCINVGTSSSVILFDLAKRVSTKTIKVKTHFYTLTQKINKEVYFLDNHSLSVIDWRVPFPLINLIKEENFIENWVSDPYTLDFYQIRNNKLIYTNNSKSAPQSHDFEGQLRDYCWKKDKVYFLTDTSLNVFQSKRNQFVQKHSFSLSDFIDQPIKLHVKNDLWICGTRDGSLIVNQFK